MHLSSYPQMQHALPISLSYKNQDKTHEPRAQDILSGSLNNFCENNTLPKSILTIVKRNEISILWPGFCGISNMFWPICIIIKELNITTRENDKALHVWLHTNSTYNNMKFMIKMWNL